MKVEERCKQIKLAVFNRLFLLLIGFAIWSVAILFRLVLLQAWHHEDYALRSESQQRAFIEVSDKRGEILDRHLEELAVSVEAASVYADPMEVEDPPAVSRRLAPILELPEEELLRKLESHTRFTYLKRQMSPTVGRRIRELGLKGIHLQKENKRVYPNRKLAAQILGFVGIDNKGLGGLEYYFDKYLRGKKARIDIRVDARRNVIERSVTSAAGTQGNTLVLTLDKTIQHIAENALREVMEKTQALNGSVVVMNPHNGEILAMASYPFFNPNSRQKYSADHRRNRPILDVYEPGSTFKIVTLSSVLNEGLSTPDEILDCRIGQARIGHKVYREAHGSFQDLSFIEIFAKSSNVGTVQLGMRLGEKLLHRYISRFGFGMETGIDLPGEEAGIFRPETSWSKISIGAISIGQEIGVTPLQLIRAAAVIANGGFLVRPMIVRKIVSPEGEVLLERTPEKERILKAKVARIMRAVMQETVLRGTGKASRLRGYTSAGKTGTAQKFIDGSYSRSRFVASFVGFAPAENPALICLVVINEPKGVTYGGPVAGPVFKEIMERSLLYLKVPKNDPDDFGKSGLLLADTGSSPASPVEKAADLTAFSDQTEGRTVSAINGNRIVVNVRDRTVTFPLGNQTMPDLVGKTLRQVAEECARLGIKPKIRGSGIAVGQRPAAGTRINRNLVCEVYFSTGDNRATAEADRGNPGGFDSRSRFE